MQHVIIFFNMLKTYLYIPERLDKKIKQTAKAQNKSKAEIMRQALEKGIPAVNEYNNASTEILFKIAELGKKNKIKGPKDSSINMDKYLWDKDWAKHDE